MRSLILITALTSGAWASPIFDGGAADTWVHVAGEAPQAVRIGERTVSAVAAGAAVRVATSGGGFSMVPVDPARTQVWVNAAARSWRPLAANAPDIALAGLSDGLFAEAGALRAEARPDPGEYDRTVRVVLTAAGPGAQISYRLNDRQVDVNDDRVELALMENGAHAITWWARNRDGRSEEQTGRWTIQADPRRDTDGDGIPDRVERAFNGDPFSAQNGRDAAALDDWLRRRREGDAEDPDRDGWATFDERLRGTNPNDANSHPTATERYGVEARFELTVPQPERVTLAAWDARWRAYEPRGREGEPIERLADLESRRLPILRLPLSAPLVVRATQGSNAVKAWHDPEPTVDPTQLNLGDWADVDAWADAVEAQLAERLVVNRPLTLDRESTRRVLVWEALLAAFGDAESAPLVLGDDTLGTSADALDRLTTAWGSTSRITAWLAALRESEPLAEALASVMRIERPDPYAVLDQRWAATLQQSREGFAVQALAAIGPGIVVELNGEQQRIALAPDADFDGDGIRNADEVAAGLDLHRVDTDRDGVDDRADPCPSDAANQCGGAVDRDADGVIDPLDNCVPLANADQRDADADGIGDVCEERFGAVIVAPALDPVRLTGETLVVRAAYTDRPVELRWDFDGLAAPSNALAPAPIPLHRPGTYRIRLTTDEAIDERVVTVVGPDRTPLDLSVRVPNQVQEGERIRLRPRGSDGFVAWDWQLGDGATADSAHAQHVYVDDGLYAGRLTAVHADGRFAEAEFVVSVADTAPVPAFDVATPEGLTRIFTDRSAAYDGIARVRWDFGDGARAEGLEVQHRFAEPGQYPVEIAVEDGDGSITTLTRIIEVDDACADSDLDGVCDAFDGCPDIPDATQLDADADGQNDACGPASCQVLDRACAAQRTVDRQACDAARRDCRSACPDADCRAACDLARVDCRDAADVARSECAAQACTDDRVCTAAARAEETRCRVLADAAFDACQGACDDGGCRVGCTARRTESRAACDADFDARAARCAVSNVCDAACVDARNACTAAAVDGDARAECQSIDARCALACADPAPRVPPEPCEADSDNDGRCDAVDNCPDDANASQADLDADGLGDACAATCDAREAACAQQLAAALFACKATRRTCRDDCRDAGCRAGCDVRADDCARLADDRAAECEAELECTPRTLCRAAVDVEYARCRADDGEGCDLRRTAARRRCDAGQTCARDCAQRQKSCTRAANVEHSQCRAACGDAACRARCAADRDAATSACFESGATCFVECP